MKKILLFAIAISLSAVAFALNNVDCSVEGNCHCNFFSQEQYYGIKGCHSCPVRENGQFLKCENVAAATGGEIDRDCCWLNTPKAPGRPAGHPWRNCYTNAYVILDPSYGPPWAVQCVQLLDNLVGTGANGGTSASNGGTNTGTSGSNGTTNSSSKILKNKIVTKPISPKPEPRPVVSVKTEKSDKQPVQPKISSKKTTK